MALAPLAAPITSRMLLRPLVPRDAKELLSVVTASREPLGRYMTWPREMLTIDHARRFVTLGRDGWLAERTARYGMFSREDGSLLGSIELDGIDLRRSQAELGYWIRSDRTNHGLVTEAGRAMLYYAFGSLALHKVRADVAVGNVGSGRVLEKLGFHLEGTLKEDRPIAGFFTDHWRFGLLAREFGLSLAPR